MQLFELITEENFLIYAAHCYDNPQAVTVEEFYDDLNRFKYLKRLFNRYDDGDLQERLILNHLIVIHNVFSIEGGIKMSFHKMHKKHWSYLKTCLVYLGYLDNHALSNIEFDTGLQEALSRI